MSNQTGPTSAAGKAVSSANATTHNGCSERLIIEGERLEDYQNLVSSLADHYQPADPHEQSLVEELAHDRWILWRRRRAFTNVEADVYALQPNEAKWTEADFKRLALVDRYQTTAQRAFQRSLKNVEAFAKERVQAYRWEAMHDLAVKRLELAKRKHELEGAKAAMRARKILQNAGQPIPSVKSAVSSPAPPAAAPIKTSSIPLNLTEIHPKKETLTA